MRRGIKQGSGEAEHVIEVIGARQHNLKGVNVQVPRGKMTVVTGPSGSGKSSLAFHTLYAEGQRRYVETFSPYVRQFLDRMDKPVVDEVKGIPPAIAIEQKNQVRTTRSTVGTLTEINDYLKLLYPRLAIGFDPETGERVQPQSPGSVLSWLVEQFAGAAGLVVFPVAAPVDGEVEEFFEFLQAQGFLRVLVDGEVFRTDDIAGYLKRAGKLPSEVLVVQDRVKIPVRTSARVLEALETGFKLGKGEVAFAIEDDGRGDGLRFRVERRFRQDWYPLVKPVPGLFSFNSPLGACPDCRGFGKKIGIDMGLAIAEEELSLAQGCVTAFRSERGVEATEELLDFAEAAGIDIHVPFAELSEADQDWVKYGEQGAGGNYADAVNEGKWYGVKGFFDQLEHHAYKMHVRVFLSRFRSYTTCPVCRGKRLNPMALNFFVGGKTLPDLWQMPVEELVSFMWNEVAEPAADDTATRTILQEVRARLGYLCEVGLGYLTLDRPARTLSGGEIERVNLTTCLGAALTDTLFVLDEPTVGLHGRDVDRLIGVMHQLRDRGNTLVVVEHEESVMRAADYVIDIGPGAGELGGEVVYQGKPEKMKGTLTGDYLTGVRSIEVPDERREPLEFLRIRGACRHNLNKLDVDLPLGVLCGVTGVSGSGKSTLVHDVIYLNLCRRFRVAGVGEPAKCRDLRGEEHLDGVILVDQSNLARTPRSTPAVFVGAFDSIRKLFANAEQGKRQGLTPGFFSFNSGNGRCGRCWGSGFERVEMQFLSDVYITCPECSGSRYSSEALAVHYRDVSIAEVLEMTVEAALEFFSNDEEGDKVTKAEQGKIVKLLSPLKEVGLGYLRLGQPLNTLSGGESQRLKLVGHLSELKSTSTGAGQQGKSKRALASKSKRGKLLIFDEPTTGLHFGDVERLLGVFQKLVGQGHSVVVIEHNAEVIKSCDYLIDMGPDGGVGGGEVVGVGTPEQLAGMDSPTGQLMQQALWSTDRKLLGEGAQQLVAERSYPSYGASGNRMSEGQLFDPLMISVRGAREHNLKNLSVDLPKGQMVVVTGLSGSGKSTLAFDIIFAEGQRRFLDSMSPYARQFAEQLQRPDIDVVAGLPPTVAIEQRVSRGGGKSTVATVTEVWHFLRLLFAKTGRQHCPESGEMVVNQTVSAIVKGVRAELKNGEVKLLAPLIKGRKGYHTDVAKWALKKGYSKLLVDRQFKSTEDFERLERFVEHDIDVVIAEIGEGVKPKTTELMAWVETALEIGNGSLRLLDSKKRLRIMSTAMVSPATGRSFEALDPKLFSFNSPRGWCPQCRGYGEIPRKSLRLRDQSSVLEEELAYDKAMSRKDDDERVICPSCGGARLNEVALAVKVGGVTIDEFGKATVSEARELIARLKFSGADKQIARDIVPEIEQRLKFLETVGLSYLRLDRAATTLSGGESQRIRLAAQLGSNLRGVLYVLDEPTIGLHPRDNEHLLATLEELRDRGNSLLVVEHDEATLRRADYLLDLGPGAGQLGGEVAFVGKLPSLVGADWQARLKELAIKHPGSNTLRILNESETYPLKGERRKVPATNAKSGWLRVYGAKVNNLAGLDVRFPVGCLTVLTGISGSGKSSLMRGVLAPAAQHALNPRKAAQAKTWKKLDGFEQIGAVYEVDQSPIGKTSRSTPATYVKLMDEIRKLFAGTPEARVRGYTASRFSFNNKEGHCPECGGNGRIKLEMDFLPSSWVHCDACDGLRYNSSTLEVKYKGCSIGEVLQMTISDATEFFAAVPKIHRTLKLLSETGLGYLRLGQPSPTLSGGEAQRIKLITELTKGAGRTQNERLRNIGKIKSHLYLIEEPTIGLHHGDVKRLIDVLQRLVDVGHTVVVIEHNTSLMAEADYLIDIGPEAGPFGGKIVAQGPPEKVSKVKESRTAPFVAALMGR